MRDLRPTTSFKGVTIAVLLFVVWAMALYFCVFVLDWRESGWIWNWPAVFGMSFLFAGLFITAHDAMHGLISPGHKSFNDLVGQIALFLYAGFSYHSLRCEHHRHHEVPASEQDPDFHDGQRNGILSWYFRFLWHYRSWRPILFFSVAHLIVVHWARVPFVNFACGWAVPALLSSFQLFFFGTYLPHKEQPDGYNDQRAVSNAYPAWLSLLTCYHFGYHYEHHKWPFVPWWRLQLARKRHLNRTCDWNGDISTGDTSRGPA